MTLGRTTGLTLLALAAVCAGGPASADESSDLKRARALFTQGEAHFASGAYEEARAAYVEAYELSKRPGFHFNIGQCHRKLGQHEQAIGAFKRYLAESEHAPHAGEARQMIELSEQALAEDAARQPAPVTEEESPPDLIGEPVAAPAAAPVVAPAAAPQGADDRRRLRPLYFWAAVGVGGAMLVTSVVTGAMSLGRSSDFKDPATPREQLDDLRDSGETLRTTANLTFGLALGAGAAAAALYFFTDFSGRGSSQVSAAPTPGGAFVQIGGRF